MLDCAIPALQPLWATATWERRTPRVTRRRPRRALCVWRELSRVRRCRHSPSSPPPPTVVAAPSPVGAQVVSPGSGSDGAVRRNAGHAATLQSTAYPDVRTCHESFRRGARVSAAQPCYGTRTIGADGKVRSRIARARAQLAPFCARRRAAAPSSAAAARSTPHFCVRLAGGRICLAVVVADRRQGRRGCVRVRARAPAPVYRCKQALRPARRCWPRLLVIVRRPRAPPRSLPQWPLRWWR
jgi:hypothetical protein